MGNVAIPRFANVETKPTDFNDLALLEGCAAVALQIMAVVSLPAVALPALVKPCPMPAPATVGLLALPPPERPMAVLPVSATARAVVEDDAAVDRGALDTVDTGTVGFPYSVITAPPTTFSITCAAKSCRTQRVHFPLRRFFSASPINSFGKRISGTRGDSTKALRSIG